MTEYKFIKQFSCDGCGGLYFNDYEVKSLYLDFDNCVHKMCSAFCIKKFLEKRPNIKVISCVCCKGKIRRDRKLKEKFHKYCHCSDVFEKPENTVCNDCNKQILHYQTLNKNMEKLNSIRNH